ncbi:MAG: efflux RND transporter periplasmic adaptor subunit, partial [Gammaproteobacteria bacterium]|nr:efflux RND transporter periplasmic adaptor subunit [Gammaproteobacteria bacterium]
MNMNTEYQLNLDQNGNQPQRGPIAILKRNSRKLTIVTGILLFAMLIIFLLNAFKPEAQKQAIPETVVRVDVIQAQLSEYPVVVQANGTIEAVTRGNLVAQVRGEIVQTAENFKTGGVFKKGDLLIQIDQRDYLSDVSRTRANLSQAEVAYQQEQANARQAQLDWERLGNTQPAPDLVMRKPQLAAAKAALDSARAAHQTARLNLSRTTVTAPYDGRIIQRAAVRGQYVSVGTPIAEVFATDGVEVRLPLSQVEFNQLGLDQFGVGGAAEPQFQVTVNSEFGTQEYSWAATITRTDSTFDMSTRQIDVIAEVIDPFGKKSGQPALKIGQFVNAQIQGQSIEGVFVIPNKSIREGHYV